MNLSTKQTHRAQTCGCQVGGSGEIEGLGLANASYYIGWINNNFLQDSTGNCIQYPVINHNGKNMKKNAQILPARMWNRVFICLFPTALIAYTMILCVSAQTSRVLALQAEWVGLRVGLGPWATVDAAVSGPFALMTHTLLVCAEATFGLARERKVT